MLFFIILSCFIDMSGVLTVLKNVKIVMIEHVKLIKVEEFDTWLHFQLGKAT